MTMIGRYALFPNVQNKILNWECFITIFLLLVYIFVFSQSDLGSLLGLPRLRTTALTALRFSSSSTKELALC